MDATVPPRADSLIHQAYCAAAFAKLRDAAANTISRDPRHGVR
jgi:hypothetical protein